MRKREIAYRAPARSRRNVFGAYTLYDLMARLVLGDPASYSADRAEAFDARSGVNVTVEVERQPRRSKGLIATPESGLRMSALNFRCAIRSEHLSVTKLADRLGSRARMYGMAPNPDARIVLLGSSPLSADPAMLEAPMALLGAGPVGVFAAASSAAKRTAAEHVRLLARHGVHAVDLGVTIDTVDYAEQNHELLEDIAGLRGILFCGGNQIRLVETLLHRGEESAVLRAIARAHAQGAVLIAASGAASALSGVMIAGGSSYEALRYGVSSDTGHRGLVIQEGIGLFGGGIVDQNLIGGNRLGRLVVACAEESERFGVGVFEDSAVIASHAGSRLQATGLSGFVLVEIDLTALELQTDSFAARGVRLTVLAPGDSVDIADGSGGAGGAPRPRRRPPRPSHRRPRPRGRRQARRPPRPQDERPRRRGRRGAPRFGVPARRGGLIQGVEALTRQGGLRRLRVLRGVAAPGAVEGARPVDPLEAVRAEEVALGLQEVGGAAAGPHHVEVAERGRRAPGWRCRRAPPGRRRRGGCRGCGSASRRSAART